MSWRASLRAEKHYATVQAKTCRCPWLTEAGRVMLATRLLVLSEIGAEAKT